MAPDLPATSNTTPDKSNPYVGPKMFEPDQKDLFFGRDQEAGELLSLVVTRHIVLFYAQSGAGKSSLINARLIPSLSEERGFEVLRVGRVSGDAPADFQVDNIYVYNLLTRLDESNTPRQHFAKLTLSDFLLNLAEVGKEFHYQMEATGSETGEQGHTGELASSAQADPISQAEWHEEGESDYAESEDLHVAPRVLIIDQFEELFTTHPEAWALRADFFRQLAQAMEDDPYLHVLLSMREDYIAQLTPMFHLIPDSLPTRYYMQRLQRKAASDAITEPARKRGIRFTPEASDALVRNLLQVRRRGSARVELHEGQFVEPVQLQVVCLQMWDRLVGDEDGVIQYDELVALADNDLMEYVNKALAEFYEKSIGELDSNPVYNVTEYQVRNWFTNELISEERTRKSIYRGSEKTGNLPNNAVTFLAGKLLIRGEERSGEHYYELIHDRFIDPILRANLEWQLSQLEHDPVARAAHAWIAAGEPKEHDLLLRGDELKEALTTTNLESAAPEVKRFLAQSKEAEQLREAAKASRYFRWISAAIVVVIGIAIAMGILWFRASDTAAALEEQVGETEQARRDEAAQRIVAEQQTTIANQALIVAQEQTKIAEQAQTVAELERERAKVLSIVDQARNSSDPTFGLLLGAEAFDVITTTSNAATRYAAEDALLRAIDTESRPHNLYTSLLYLGLKGQRALLDPQGKQLAIVSDAGTLSLWNLETPNASPLRLPLPRETNLHSVVYSPDASTLFVGSGTEDPLLATLPDFQIIQWDLTATPPLSYTFATSLTAVYDLAIDPDGTRLVAALGDGSIAFWDITVALSLPLTSVITATGTITTAGTITATGPVSHTLPQTHTNGAFTLAFSPDGKQLASAGKDGSLYLWGDLDPIEQADQTESAFQPIWQISPKDGNREWVNQVIFSHDGRKLATGSNDNSAIIWDLTQKTPISMPLVLGANVNAVAFSADDLLLATGDLEGNFALWETQSGKILERIDATGGQLLEILIDPATGDFVSIDSYGAVLSWQGKQGGILESARANIPTLTLNTVEGGSEYRPQVLEVRDLFYLENALAGFDEKSNTLWWYKDQSGPITYTLPISGAKSAEDEVMRDSRMDNSAAAIFFDPGLFVVAATQAPVVATVRNGIISLFNLGTDELQERFEATELVVTAIALSPDGNFLTYAGCPQLTYESAAVQRAIEARDSAAAAVRAGITPTLTRSLCDDGTLHRWNLTDDSVTTLPSDLRITTQDRLAMSADGRWIAFSQRGAATQIWDMQASPSPTAQLLTPLDLELTDLEFAQHAGTTLLLSVSEEGNLVLWRRQGARFVPIQVAAKEDNLTAATISPDGSRLVMAGCDDGVNRAALERPGDISCTTHYLQLWDIATKTPLGPRLRYGRDETHALFFHPQEPLLVVSKRNGEQMLWHLDPAEWRIAACALAGRNFTAPEWEKVRLLLQDSTGAADTRTCEQPPYGYPQHLTFVTAAIEEAQVALRGCRNVNDARTRVEEARLLKEQDWPDLPMDFEVIIPDMLIAEARIQAELGNLMLVEECLTLANQELGHEEYDIALLFSLIDDIEKAQKELANANYVESIAALDAAKEKLSGFPFWPTNALAESYFSLCRVPQAEFSEHACDQFLSIVPRIESEQMVSGTVMIDTPSYWLFQGNRGDIVKVRLESDLRLATRIELLNMEDEPISSGTSQGGETASEITTYPLPEEGLYLLRPSGYYENQNFTYRLSLTSRPSEAIQLGELITGTMNNDDVWALDWQEGNYISITLSCSECSKDSALQLLDSRGVVQSTASLESANGSAKIVTRRDSNERYYLRLKSDDVDSDKSFQLMTAELVPQPIKLDEMASGTMGVETLWSFEGKERQYISITLACPACSENSRITLYDGNRVLQRSARTDFAMGQARLEGFLNTNGTYSLLLREAVADQDEEYQLYLSEIYPEPIRRNDAITMTIGAPALWSFDADAQEIISLTLVCQACSSTTWVQLLDSQGDTLDSAKVTLESGQASLTHLVPYRDEYFIHVNSAHQSDLAPDEAAPDEESIEEESIEEESIEEKSIEEATGAEDTTYQLLLSEVTPQPIHFGETLSNTVAGQGLWTFEGKVGQSISITFACMTCTSSTTIDLQDSIKQTISTGYYESTTKHAYGTHVLTRDGSYYLRIRNFDVNVGAAPYQLTLLRQEPSTLSLNTVVSDTLGNSEIWSFETDAAQLISITWKCPTCSSQAILRLANESTDRLSSVYIDPASTETLLTEYINPAERYFIHLSDVASDMEIPYELAVTPIVAEPLPYNQLQNSSSNKHRWWAFFGQEGVPVSLSLLGITAADSAALALYDASGTRIVSPVYSENGTDALKGFELPATGTYFVEVIIGSRARPYTLLLTKSLIQPIKPNQTVTGVLDEKILWSFDGKAGQPISITLSCPKCSVLTTVELLDSTKSWLGSASITGGVARLNYFLNRSSRYYIFTKGGTLDSANPYEITLMQESPAPIAVGDVVTGTMRDQRLWAFTGKESQLISITLACAACSENNGFNLLDSTGARVGSGALSRDSGQATLQQIVGWDGRYFIQFHDFRADDADQYQLMLGEVEPLPLALNEPESSTANEKVWWSFEGKAGQVLSFSFLDGPPSYNISVAIYNSTGMRLYVWSDSSRSRWGEPLIDTVLLPADDTYYLEFGNKSYSASHQFLLQEGSPQTIYPDTRATLANYTHLRFEAEAGRWLSIAPVTFDAHSLSAPRFALLDPEGEIIVKRASAFLTKVPAAGEYEVVSLEGYAPSTKKIDLKWLPLTPRPLSFGGVMTGTLTPGEIRKPIVDSWSFMGDATDTLALTLTSNADVEMELYAPSGRLLHTQRSTIEDTYHLTASLQFKGQYILLIRDADGAISSAASGEGQSYRLEAEQIDELPIPQECDMSNENVTYGPLQVGTPIKLHRYEESKDMTAWTSARNRYGGMTTTVYDLAGVDSAGCPVVTLEVDPTITWPIRDLSLAGQ